MGYHNKQHLKYPTSGSTKDIRKRWLRERRIGFDDNMLKTELYAIVKAHKPKFVMYKINRIFSENNIAVNLQSDK